MNATFFERIGAYLIDAILIGVIASLICTTIPNKTEDLTKEMEELSEKMTQNEITAQEYFEGYKELIYKQQKSNVLENTVNVILTLGYFVVFQYMNKGQTIGKKLLKIKVVDKDTEKPTTVLKGLLRSIFTLSIASATLNILFIFIFNKDSYIIGYLITTMIELLFVFITIIFIVYRKDRRGLHDIMANTKVIREGKW
mgnify:FL=1